MGKRRVGFKKSKNPVNALKNAASSDEEEGELEAILDDEIGRYHSEKDEALLKKGKKSGKSKDEDDNEQEVYGLNLESEEEDDDGPTFDSDEDMNEDDEDDDDDDEDDNDEDVFGKKEKDGDRIPDSRAWGKKARTFHSTDYVDQDFGGMEGEDAERAQLEEEEAKAIQKRLTAELDESDFMDFLPVKESSQAKRKDTGKEYLKLDLDSLSVSEKRKLVERECPEIPHLLEELKDYGEELTGLKKILKSETRPVLKKFYETKQHLLMNYCVNISFFLYQRSSNPQNCAGHPSIKKILQYRKLIDELKLFDVKKLAKTEFNDVLVGDRPTSIKNKGFSTNLESSADKLNNVEPELGVGLLGTEAEKRKITYEMAKNKGLMPKRKKEQRNPRVKHREKFRKAKIRRKGQIRTPRTETQRYGGEMSGIKSNVTKSIKFK